MTKASVIEQLSFGEQQLMKLGWQRGKGLGLLEDGIHKPITVAIKNDTNGLGRGVEDFSFDWWDSLYNKTASITNNRGDGTKCNSADAKGSSISSSNKCLLKADTEKKKSNSKNPTVIEKKDYSQRVTDKELFEMCGNRSGNQRARLNSAKDEPGDVQNERRKKRKSKKKSVEEEKKERKRRKEEKRERRMQREAKRERKRRKVESNEI